MDSPGGDFDLRAQRGRWQVLKAPVMGAAWQRELEFPAAASREVLRGGPGLRDSGPEVLRS